MAIHRRAHLVCVVICAFACTASRAGSPPWADYRDDPDVRKLFFDEYPDAYQRLVDAVKRMRGTATMRRTDGTSDEQQRFLQFTQYNDHLVLRVSRSEEDANVKDHAALVTPRHAAMIRAPLTAAATPLAVDPQPGRMLQVFLWRSWGLLVESTFAVAAMRIQPRLASGEWSYVRGRRDPSDPTLVAIHFAFVNKDEFWGSLPPRGTIDVVFDPRSDWAVRKYRMHSVPYNLVSEGEVEVTRIPGLGVLPNKVRVTDHDVPPSASPHDWKLIESTECVFSSFNALSDFPDEEFTLKALGVTTTFGQRRWQILVFGNLLFLAMILTAFILLKWRRRRLNR